MKRILPAFFALASVAWSQTNPASIAARQWREKHERQILTEFVELLGLLAHELGDAAAAAGRGRGGGQPRPHLTTTAGVAGDAGAALPMLMKLHLLFSNMLDCGAKFEGDAYKIVRPVLDGLRRGAHAARHSAGRAAAAADNGERRRVHAVLAETVMA